MIRRIDIGVMVDALHLVEVDYQTGSGRLHRAGGRAAATVTIVEEFATMEAAQAAAAELERRGTMLDAIIRCEGSGLIPTKRKGKVGWCRYCGERVRLDEAHGRLMPHVVEAVISRQRRRRPKKRAQQRERLLEID